MTTKAPARRGTARTPAHSTAKRATPYPEEVKGQALDVMREEGLAAAHRATGVPRPTLSRWAKAEGIDLGEQARARTAHANDAVRRRAMEVRASTVELLEGHIAQAGHYLATVAGTNAVAADLIANVDDDQLVEQIGLAGPYVVITDAEAKAAATRALALAALPLAPRDAEGLLTRAIHDLQLLRGEATERGELVVEFTLPRPNPATPVVEQDALGIEAP